MNTQNGKLRIAQLKLLEALRELKDICDTHGIEYWLDAGSLLGAIRHGGFIPWDDDIDICMTRKDFNKFISISEMFLDKEKYFLQTAKNDKFYKTIQIPCKLRVKGTEIIEKSEMEYGYYDKNSDHGIFIDIFPYDKYSTNRIVRKYIERSLSLLFMAKFYSSCKGKMTAKKNILKLIGFMLPKVILINIVRFVSGLMNKRNGLFFYSAGIETPFERALFEKSDIFPLRNINFDGVLVKCPNKIHLYLTKMFGATYMELPPEEQQISHFQMICVDGHKINNQH